VIHSKPPEQVLECKDIETSLPDGATQADVTAIFIEVFYAWKDCKDKLGFVKRFLEER
jgi:hypothetical protein